MVRKIVQKTLDKVVDKGKMEVVRDLAYDIPCR